MSFRGVGKTRNFILYCCVNKKNGMITYPSKQQALMWAKRLGVGAFGINPKHGNILHVHGVRIKFNWKKPELTGRAGMVYVDEVEVWR